MPLQHEAIRAPMAALERHVDALVEDGADYNAADAVWMWVA
jgi:hypothetical protein